MSKRNKVLLKLFLAVALVLLIPLGLRWQAQRQLSAYRKKLIASGEKLTVADLVPKGNAPATNTAQFLQLASRLPPLWDRLPTAMCSIQPGVARVAWKQQRCLETKDDKSPPTDVWPVFMEAARTNEQTLNELMRLVDAGGIAFVQADNDNINDNSGAFMIAGKELVMDLDARALLALHEGFSQQALDDFRSCAAVSQWIAKNPSLIAQWVRFQYMSISAASCWEALQAGFWNDDQLAELQRPWQKLDILADAVRCFEFERARAALAFQKARSSRQEMARMTEGASGIRPMSELWEDFWLDSRKGIKEILTAYPRYWSWSWIGSYREERQYLEAMQSVIEDMRDAQKRRKSVVVSAYPATNFMLLQPNDPFAQRLIGQAARAQTLANMVTAAIALERFRLAHHVYPADLANLVPEFLSAVPVDYMDGHDLRYRLHPDGTFLLYSVGFDGVDNGGDPTPRMGAIASFFAGRDWVWPRAATAQEMQAYEDQQSIAAKSK